MLAIFIESLWGFRRIALVAWKAFLALFTTRKMGFFLNVASLPEGVDPPLVMLMVTILS